MIDIVEIVDKNTIEEFRVKLLEWYIKNGRKFPWRKGRLSNYKIVLTECLLQRTKAKTVTTYYSDFFDKFPNWRSLSKTGIKKLECALRPFGLYKQRAARIKILANVMDSNGGRVPCEYDSLIKMPMIGQYIAYTILSVICNQSYPMLDVNMARVLERYFGPRKKADIRDDEYLQDLAFNVVRNGNSKEINWAILDFAASVCTSKNPKCDTCVLKRKCIYYNKDLT